MENNLLAHIEKRDKELFFSLLNKENVGKYYDRSQTLLTDWIVKLLNEWGVNCDLPHYDSNGTTALMWSISNKNIEICNLLLSYKETWITINKIWVKFL